MRSRPGSYLKCSVCFLLLLPIFCLAPCSPFTGNPAKKYEIIIIIKRQELWKFCFEHAQFSN
jgi:hypothetical protein